MTREIRGDERSINSIRVLLVPYKLLSSTENITVPIDASLQYYHHAFGLIQTRSSEKALAKELPTLSRIIPNLYGT